MNVTARGKLLMESRGSRKLEILSNSILERVEISTLVYVLLVAKTFYPC